MSNETFTFLMSQLTPYQQKEYKSLLRDNDVFKDKKKQAKWIKYQNYFLGKGEAPIDPDNDEQFKSLKPAPKEPTREERINELWGPVEGIDFFPQPQQEFDMEDMSMFPEKRPVEQTPDGPNSQSDFRFVLKETPDGPPLGNTDYRPIKDSPSGGPRRYSKKSVDRRPDFGSFSPREQLRIIRKALNR